MRGGGKGGGREGGAFSGVSHKAHSSLHLTTPLIHLPSLLPPPHGQGGSFSGIDRKVQLKPLRWGLETPVTASVPPLGKCPRIHTLSPRTHTCRAALSAASTGRCNSSRCAGALRLPPRLPLSLPLTTHLLPTLLLGLVHTCRVVHSAASNGRCSSNCYAGDLRLAPRLPLSLPLPTPLLPTLLLGLAHSF